MAKNQQPVSGLIPPQSIELEKDLLGCILVDTSVMGKIVGLVSVDTFYHPAHQYCFEAMINLFRKNYPIDYLILIDELKKINKLDAVGGEYYIKELTNIISISNYEIYARRLEEMAIGRRMISICNETQKRIFDGSEDVFAVISEHNDNVFKSQSSISSHKNVTPGYVGDLLIEQMMQGMEQSGMIGVPSLIPEIDNLTGGFQKQHVITIGARTRHGKSAIAAGFMYNSASIPNESYGIDPLIKNQSQYPIGFLSMEMRNTEVFSRLVSMEIKKMYRRSVSYSRISRGRISQEEANMVVKAKESLSERGIYIDDTPALNTMMVKSKVMKMISDYGIRMVYIDYVQLISDDSKKNNNRAQIVSGWYSDFKNMAKFFDIPFAILSQMDRNTEKGDHARPGKLSDLKDSGGIEEKSDVVMLLYRPEVNDPNAVDMNGVSLKKKIIVDVAKNKQGDIGVVTLPFDVATNTFGEDFEVTEDVPHTVVNILPQGTSEELPF